MRIFISHKSEDKHLAEKYAIDLQKLGFKIYFDEYDPYVTESPDRAKHLQDEIEKSTDLLVIITKNTKQSWWVPFEIGLSTSVDNRIVSITHEGSPPLPSFIRKWPIVDTDEEYGEYLKQLKMNSKQLIAESRNFSNTFKSASVTSQMRESDLFHKLLMAKFDQL